jgi:hypothetical protein
MRVDIPDGIDTRWGLRVGIGVGARHWLDRLWVRARHAGDTCRGGTPGL